MTYARPTAIWVSIISLIWLVSYWTIYAYKYATTTTLEDVSQKIEVFKKAESDLVQAKLEYCYDHRLDSKKCEEVMTGSWELNAKATTGSVIPVAKRPENKSLSLECEWGKIGKIEGIEFHYTATDDDTTLQAIKNWHTNKYGADHIGYHYVIKPNGEITNTRDESCVAGADKWHKNNYRFIHVAFVGDDKPSKEQAESMAKLAKILIQKYNLSFDSVSAHADWWPKSKKESLEYWFWSKEEFIKMIRYQYSISIYGKESLELTYMWKAWWDLDFITTIFQESRFNNNSRGDGGNSYGYCQIHKGFQPWWHSEYMKLETMEERLNYCHEKYIYASTLKGGIWSRFHWFNARHEHLKNISIK